MSTSYCMDIFNILCDSLYYYSIKALFKIVYLFNFHRYLNDLYTLDLSTPNMQWQMPRTFGHPPTARESHTAAVYNNGERSPKLIVYGGMSGCRLGDIYVLDCSEYYPLLILL